MRKIFLFFFLFILTSCQHSRLIDVIYHLAYREPAPISKDIQVALVLGSGGSRAIAHIGVIEVLEENNIPIDLIVGVSGGSVIGALYADNPKAADLKTIGLNFKKKDVIKLSLKNALDGTTSLQGGFDGKLGEEFLSKNLKAKEFEQLKIPFISVATDITTGKTVPIRSGLIAPAVRASCAIPGLFSPVELYGMILVDGAITAPVPVKVAKEFKPKVIIAVDINVPIKEVKVKNMIELVHRSANISYEAFSNASGLEADILIKPKMGNVGMFDDDKNIELYLAGREAAKNILKR